MTRDHPALFVKILAIAFVAMLSIPAAADNESPWFRDVGEWMSTRSTRQGVMTDDNAKMVTNNSRYDFSVGKRFPLLTWDEKGLTEGWAFGLDGGMLTSLRSYRKNERLYFATNTFDGYFGAFVGYTKAGWLAMFHSAHLSAHLVDDASTFNPAGPTTTYTHFWNEILVGKEFPDPAVLSRWDLYLQGSIGLNYSSDPPARDPRHAEGLSFGYSLFKPNALALLLSFDSTTAGVRGQAASYSEFVGIGHLTRPNNTHRPFRVGISHFHGSDYRNQYYAQGQDFTALETQVEF